MGDACGEHSVDNPLRDLRYRTDRLPHSFPFLVPGHRTPPPHSVSSLVPRSTSHASQIRSESGHIRARIRKSDVSIRPDEIESTIEHARLARRVVAFELMELDAER